MRTDKRPVRFIICICDAYYEGKLFCEHIKRGIPQLLNDKYFSFIIYELSIRSNQMKKELHIQSIENPSKEIYGKSDFYHLYEVDGYKYTRFAEVEIFKSNQDGEVYTYINGKQSDLSFRDYISEKSNTYEITMDSQAEELLGTYEVEFFSNGNLKSEKWLKDGQLHREDGPAQIEHSRDGTVWSETWYTQGERNRLDGPAVTEYHDNGRVNIEMWYVQNERHREDGPAYIGRSEETGQITEESWFLNDMEHRLDGPAEIYYDKDGLIDVASYYIHGEEISETDFGAATQKIIMREKSSPYRSTDKPKHMGPSL